MKHILILLTLVFFFPLANPANAARPIQELPLDSNVIYKLDVPIDDGVLTLTFPSPIQSVSGRNFAQEGAKHGDFVISSSKDAFYIQLSAKHKTANGFLTVICNRRSYVFDCRASSKPHRAITFFTSRTHGARSSSSSPGGLRIGISRTRLIQLYDRARSYSTLSRHHPDATASIAYARPARINHYKGFRVLIDEVWRFEPEDTVFFKVILHNQTNESIEYLSDKFAVRVGQHVYSQSFSHASGIMPPQTKTVAYFAITGTPSGYRNQLGVNSRWNVLVSRRQPIAHPVIETTPAALPSPAVEPEPEPTVGSGADPKPLHPAKLPQAPSPAPEVLK